MAALLSLLTALLFGVADFLGGMASKKAHVLEVVAGSHLVGLLGLLIIAPVIADGFAWSDVQYGAAGGAFGGIGILLLYRRLAEGPMQVVAPITAVASASIPVMWDLATGGRVERLEAVGLALALVAVVLVSLSRSDATATAAVTPRVIVESCLAGFGFAGFFIFLDLAESAHAPWPVVAARMLTAPAFFALAIRYRRNVAAKPAQIGRRAVLFIAGAGVLDTTANVTFLLATGEGQLALVAVLTALYPIATAALAWMVLGERLQRVQYVGFVVAVAATILIAL